jgi:deoxyribodipyrimidine photolyase-related protein
MALRLNLILGDQLNANSLIWQDCDASQDLFLMAEVKAESTQTPSSKQRTALFLSAMRHFADNIKADGYKLIYFSIEQGISRFADALERCFEQQDVDELRCVLPGDVAVVKEIEQCCKTHRVKLAWLPDNHFIARRGEFSDWLGERKQPRMEHWYRHLRREHQVLIDNGEPLGGQWNFDKDNRKSFAKAGPEAVPEDVIFEPDKLTEQVMADIERYLPDLPGRLDSFNWPVTRKQALQQLDDFIHQRLQLFGDYQDAMWTDEPFLYHARLSASLNLKLLGPMEVIEAAKQAYHDGQAPLNAVEGFIRQILGWREYVRGLYWSYRDSWLDYNALHADQDLPWFYWDGDTSMTCMQQSLSQVLDSGYGHHIQRLMVTGLFSLLWGVKPQAIHRWYLGMYVDAVAWVEIPNTIGMSQYADGGIVGSKPYIASGAYINRMSNYCSHCQYKPKQAAGEKACPFTTLYWSFIDKHQDRLSRNPRLGMQVRNWYNKGEQEQQQIRERTEWLYRNLDKNNKEQT